MNFKFKHLHNKIQNIVLKSILQELIFESATTFTCLFERKKKKLKGVGCDLLISVDSLTITIIVAST